MLMVGVVVAEVESGLRGGLLSCPSCAGVLAPLGVGSRAVCSAAVGGAGGVGAAAGEVPVL